MDLGRASHARRVYFCPLIGTGAQRRLNPHPIYQPMAAQKSDIRRRHARHLPHAGTLRSHIPQPVWRVGSSIQTSVEPKTHHPLQLVAMVRKDFSDRVDVSRLQHFQLVRHSTVPEEVRNRWPSNLSAGIYSKGKASGLIPEGMNRVASVTVHTVRIKSTWAESRVLRNPNQQKCLRRKLRDASEL